MLNGTVVTVVQYNIRTFNGVQRLIYLMEWVIVHLRTIYKYILISKYFFNLIHFYAYIKKNIKNTQNSLPGPCIIQ